MQGTPTVFSLSACGEEKPGSKTRLPLRRRDSLSLSWKNSGKGATAKEGTLTGRDSGTKKRKQECAGAQKGTERTIPARCGSTHFRDVWRETCNSAFV